MKATSIAPSITTTTSHQPLYKSIELIKLISVVDKLHPLCMVL